MLLLLFAISTLLGSTQAFTHEQANLYMDEVINTRFQEEAVYSRIDPYKLEDIKLTVNFSGRERGKGVLDNGRLIHLSKVRRAADCTVPFYQSANVTFTCFLRFDKLQVNYTADVDYDNMNVKFFPHVAVKDTNVTVQVTSNREDDIPNLRLLFVNHIGSMNVTARMISIGDLADKVGPPVREALVRHSIQNLYRAINGRFKDALAYSIYKTPVGFAK